MSVTIANLTWQNDNKELLHVVLRDEYSWMDSFSVYSGYKGKARVANYGLSSPLLSAYDCVIDTTDITLAGKDIEVPEYGFTIPVPRCDYNQTWLNGFTNGGSVEGLFLDGLRKYVFHTMGHEIRSIVLGDIFAEATLDTDVIKVAGSAVTTPANAYAAIKKFIEDLPLDFLAESLGVERTNEYVIYVSPEAFVNAQLHLADLSGNLESFVVGGYSVQPAAGLVDGQMGCTFLKNLMVIFDDKSDANDFKVIPKDELNLDYVSGGVAVVGSYKESAKIILTDNF